MKQYLTIIAAALVLASCSGNQPKTDDPLADNGRTQRTENLLTNLKQLGDSGVYLFGHQDDAVSGVGWSGNENRSDVERATLSIATGCRSVEYVKRRYVILTREVW